MKRNNIQDIRTTLSALKSELQLHADQIDANVLRAVRNLGMNDINAVLDEHVPGYRALEPEDEEILQKRSA